MVRGACGQPSGRAALGVDDDRPVGALDQVQVELAAVEPTSSAGLPAWAISPPFLSRTISSPRAIASEMSWVTKTTVL